MAATLPQALDALARALLRHGLAARGFRAVSPQLAAHHRTKTVQEQGNGLRSANISAQR
jgi:hypothetical protein